MVSETAQGKKIQQIQVLYELDRQREAEMARVERFGPENGSEVNAAKANSTRACG